MNWNGRNRNWVAVAAAAAMLAHSLMAAGSDERDVRRDAAVRAVEMVLPSVVNVSTETLVEVQDPIANLFQDFFGPYYRRRPQALKSLGSGVIIDADGYVLTNYHVVHRASRITVTLSNGLEYEAVPVSYVEKTDLAVIKLKSKGEKFPAIKLAADDDLILGETVLALGNPFGLGESVSRGILSSKARRPPNADEPQELDIADWLQTDAAINPGNSGGPLVDLRGQLIGLNVAVFREGQGIGFAIPVKRISEALSDIFTPEKVGGRWFGARFRMTQGRLVASAVEQESPAERAGLRVGDRVLQVNGTVPGSLLEINRELIGASGQTVNLVIERDGRRVKLAVRLKRLSDFFNAEMVRKKIGVTLQPLTPELAEAFGVEAEGLVVAEVESGSPGARAGLRVGHIVQSIDGQAVTDLVDAAKVLHQTPKGHRAVLRVLVQDRRGPFLRIYHATASVAVR